MSETRTYLDHNATAPLRPAARDATVAALGACGNASSVHAEGRAARARVERAREAVAALVGAAPGDVVFTSGGTEANAMALRPGALLARTGAPALRLVTVATEHASVLSGHGFGEAATLVPVSPDGAPDLDALRAALADGPALVSVAAANSETGHRPPLDAVAALVREAGGALHVDAVQAAGRVPLDTILDLADAVTLSGHKIGGPQGTGALVVLPARRGPAFPLLRGGGQEGRARAGTENVAGLAGFGAAAAEAARDVAGEALRLGRLRDALAAALREAAPDAVVFAEGAERLPNTLAFAVPGLAAETALMRFDLDGIALSSGSACSSGKVARSHVLAAMGVPPDLAAGALRASLGWSSRECDVAAFGRAVKRIVQSLYDGRARAAA